MDENIDFENFDWEEEEDELQDLKNDLKECIQNNCSFELPTKMTDMIGEVCDNYKDIISDYRVVFPKRDNDNFNVMDIYLENLKSEILILNVSIVTSNEID